MISLAVAKLRTRRAAAWTELASLVDQAAAEGRALTAAQEQEWTEGVARLQYLDQRLAGALEAEASRCAAGKVG